MALLTTAFFFITCVAYANTKTSVPEKINLWPEGKAPLGEGQFGGENATITVYHPASANGAAIVICPGGGYSRVVDEPEGHDIAKWLNQYGIVGVVLNYRLPHGNRHVPLADAQRALRMVRDMGKKWQCDPKRVGIMGFSAGGHLASTASTHFDAGDDKSEDSIQRQSSRPDFSILVYPVITMGKFCHEGSKTNLLGKNPSAEMILLYSNEKQVNAQTPPAYLTHAQDDKLVPPINSQMYYDALLAHKIPAHYLKLPEGGHGFHHYHGDMWATWKADALRWLAEMKFIPKS